MDAKSRHILEFDKVLGQVADLTSFSAGADLARNLEPTIDLDEARIWQFETGEGRILLDTRTDITIGGARDVRGPVDNAQIGYILPAQDLLEVRATVSAARTIHRKLVKAVEQFPNLAAIAELIEECPGLVSSISSAIDDRGEVLDSASAELAKIRKDLRVVHGRIHEKLRTLLGSSQNQYLQEPMITTRGGRYVVPLMANHKGRIKGIIHDQSNSGATLWIEPMNTVELNNDYRSLEISEEEEIQRILAELSAHVSHHGDAIKRIVNRLAELDLILARARYANITDAVLPEFVPWRTMQTAKPPRHANLLDKWQPPEPNPHPGSTLWIRGARHPMLDSAAVVPTDLLIGEDTFIVLITGPNTGGKTVSLKTTGLMVLMAQAGLHLPAVDARLTVFDNVFADIGDEQSIEQNLSTFSGHLTNIVRILEQIDERSLVLLDELGSGTDPAEGAALAQSIVNFIRDKGATTFVATHFPELKAYASQTAGLTNASVLFDVETLLPTYEMSIGMPGRSNAFAIARRLGLDDSILDEGLSLIGANSSKAESLLDSIYDMREKIMAQEAGTRLALNQTQEDREKLNQRLRDIEIERQQILDESRQKAKEELEAVRAEVRRLRKQLKDTDSKNRLKRLSREIGIIEDEKLSHPAPTLAEAESQQPRRKSGVFQVGDTVLVTTLDARGQIVKLNKNEAEVAVGRLHMRVALDELKFKERKEEKPSVEEISRKISKAPNMELDLRGKRVDEGLVALEQYLDAAYLGGLPWVRIIHGKGTGRMREATRRSLRTNQYVASWEEGRDGEGGAGVTVAKLVKD